MRAPALRRRSPSAVVLLLLLAGCGDCGGGDAVEGPDPIARGEACEPGDTCAGDLRCVDGTCRLDCAGAPECLDRCCAADELCVDGACRSEEAPCPDGGSLCGATCCQAPEDCVRGRCESPCETPRCGADLACCDAGERCHLGRSCCPDDRACPAGCCDVGQTCVDEQCRIQCPDGRVGCGVDDVCCGGEEACVSGQCVVPGGACTPSPACATRPELEDCPEGQVCDPELERCVPRVVDESCTFVPPAGVFEPRPQFTWGRRRDRSCDGDGDCQTAEVCTGGRCAVTWPHVEPEAGALPEHYQATSIPMVTDLDGDCVPEIVFNTFRDSNFTGDGVLRAIRGDDGAPVWTVTDPAYRTDSTGNPAVGDVDGDGAPEVFVIGPGRNLLRVAADGTPVWISEAFSGSQNSGSPTLAQLDGEGDAEIVFGAAVFDSAGRLLADGSAGEGFAGQGPISCVADLDGDGRPEIVAGRTIYETTGTGAGSDFALAVRANASTGDGYCGIADFDGDGAPEIALVSGGTIYVLAGTDATVLASVSIPGGGQGGAPNIADFDGDGRPDIGTAGASNYVVARYDPSGPGLSLLWRAPTEDDSSSRTGSSVFDFDGDGRSEVVYNDEEYLRIYPGTEPDCRTDPPGPACDGIMTDEEILFRDLNSSRTRTEYPVVADVDGDFKAEIVFSTSNEASFLDDRLVGDAGIEVWGDRLDNWVPTRPVWNQHAYTVGAVGPRGQLPARPAPSWTPDYNAYRRNAQGGRNPLCAPDLEITSIRQDASSCPAVTVLVTVANRGCLAAGNGVTVRLTEAGGASFAEASSAEALPPGGSIRLVAQGLGGDSFQAELIATVDPDEETSECREGNNAVAIRVQCRNEF